MTFCIERGILKQYTGQDTTVVIPPEVSEIGYRAFYQNQMIQKVILSEGIIKVGIQAFLGCTALETVIFPQSIRTIGHEALADTAWFAAQPDGVVYAGPLAWMVKGDPRIIAEITIQPGTVKLCADLFRNCTALTSIVLPELLKEIDDRAFQYCRKLQHVYIPESVIRIGDRAFDECTKLSVQVDCFDVLIGRSCFMDTALLRIRHLHPAQVPANVRDSAVKSFADDYCTGVAQDAAFIGKMRQYIGNRHRQYYPLALEHWNLMQLMLQEKLIPLEDVDDLLDTILLQNEADHVAVLMRYKQSMTACDDENLLVDPWDDLTLDWDMPTAKKTTAQKEKEWGVKKNNDGTYTLMRYYGNEKDIEIPTNIGDKVITAIGPYALSPERYGIKHESAKHLETVYTVTISDGITRIGNHAFAGCKSLRQVTMADSVEYIGKDAFADCPFLEQR